MIAYAENAAATSGNVLGMFTSLIFILVFLYFFVIRPQKKKQQEAAQMRNALKAGDKVILYSGLIGVIIELDEDNMVLEISPDDTHLTFKTWSIRQVLEKTQDDEYEYEEYEEEVEIEEDK